MQELQESLEQMAGTFYSMLTSATVHSRKRRVELVQPAQWILATGIVANHIRQCR
jgi:hypothetical protein